MIEVIAGTNRPGANARRIADLLVSLYKEQGAGARVLDLQDLPQEVFLPAAYAARPAALDPIQRRVLEAGGLHIVTPEYNGSFPGVLKYFIDLLKFPESFEGRPVAFTGEAAGLWAALRAVEHLQMIFAYRNAAALPERVFIPRVHTRFDEKGRFVDDEILALLRDQTRRFIEFTRRHTAAAPPSH